MGVKGPQVVSFKTESGIIFQGDFLEESDDGFYFKDILPLEGAKETTIPYNHDQTIKFDKTEIIWIKMP